MYHSSALLKVFNEQDVVFSDTQGQLSVVDITRLSFHTLQ